MEVLKPDWPVPPNIHSLVTTRDGGTSLAPFSSLNLGDHVGDDAQAVKANRAILRAQIPSEPIWLNQVHGTFVSTPLNRRLSSEVAIQADAAVTNQANEVLAVMTADCLPIFFSNLAGGVIGVAHAGWRGLCAGVLENTVTEMLKLDADLTPNQIMAWMGPAIGPAAFEVGEDVYAAFLNTGIAFPSNAFVAIPGQPGKYFANLYLLAQSRLSTLGVKQIYGGNFCTVTDQKRFFSHRRDAISGRFASLIWFTQ